MNQQEKKGWICLDIDGTITHDFFSIPHEVLYYLEKLYYENWGLVLVTGRIFSLAHIVLKDFKVPYYLIPQNGASIFEMPEKKLVAKKYLSLDVLSELEPILKHVEHAMIVYGGHDQGDVFFHKSNFSKKEDQNRFAREITRIIGVAHPLENFKSLLINEAPIVKIYGRQEELKEIHHSLKQVSSIKSHLLTDKIDNDFYLMHIMDKEVDKGKAVLKIMSHHILPKTIIAAGNDTNDETLLQIADIKIAMSNSPRCLLDQANLIAPPVTEMGILTALRIAVEQVERGGQ